MSYTLEYYNQRVIDEVESWPVGVHADYVRLAERLVERGPDLRMPHCRLLGGGLFELRPGGTEGEGRALYCFVTGKRIIVLHAFIKKTQRTPLSDIRLARRRIGEVKNG
jgi:phage-related protein